MMMMMMMMRWWYDDEEEDDDDDEEEEEDEDDVSANGIRMHCCRRDCSNISIYSTLLVTLNCILSKAFGGSIIADAG